VITKKRTSNGRIEMKRQYVKVEEGKKNILTGPRLNTTSALRTLSEVENSEDGDQLFGQSEIQGLLD
jgi:hypothetical protein